MWSPLGKGKAGRSFLLSVRMGWLRNWLRDGIGVTLFQKYLGTGYHELKLVLIRNINVSDDIATMGELFIDSPDSSRFCFTMEPGKKDPARPKGPIPCGVYEILLMFSLHFNREMPRLQGVPGFTYIMIHPLNWPHESEGCIGVGLRAGKDFLEHSVMVFEPLLKKIIEALKVGKVFIEVREGLGDGDTRA